MITVSDSPNGIIGKEFSIICKNHNAIYNKFITIAQVKLQMRRRAMCNTGKN
jgi:hypothetical protein